MTPEKIDKFHKSRPGYAMYGLAELGVAYIFVSLAINSGSLWEWALAIILLIGGIQNLFKLTWSLIRAKR